MTVENKNLIIEKAREWLNTPFQHQGRLKRVACDCLGLVVSAIKESGVEISNVDMSEIDKCNYSQIPDGTTLQAKLDEYLTPKNEISEMQVGDIFLMQFKGLPQHVGFIADYAEGGFSLLHSYQIAGKVVEHRLSDVWLKRIIKIYSLD